MLFTKVSVIVYNYYVIDMNEITVINETSDNIDKELLNKVASFALEYENVKKALVNIIIVDNDEIRKINKEYRGIDRETDVISFALEDDDTFIKLPIRVLGDIYISIDKAKSQAEEYGHSLKREMSFLVVHGILHLLGYDHMNESDEKVMFDKQDKILDELNIRRDYA